MTSNAKSAVAGAAIAALAATNSVKASTFSSIVTTSAAPVATVTYELVINDNGSGQYAAGDYAIYASDSTADGNAGLASFEINLKGLSSTDITNINNDAPGGHYKSSNKTYEVGFTADSTTGQTPVEGSQDTVGFAQGSKVALVYGYGQTAGNDATVIPGSTSLGDDEQPTYGAPLQLITGTYSPGYTPAFAFSSGLNSDGANVFVTNSGYATETATLSYTTTTLSIPEPASIGLLGIGGIFLGLRRRRRTSDQQA